MPNPRSAIITTSLLSSLAMLLSAAALSFAWPPALRAAQHQSAQLVKEAATANLAEANVDYELATKLDNSNQAAYLGLARTEIATGHAENALGILSKAGKGSEVTKLHIRTLLELGRPSEALSYISDLTTLTHNEADILLAALTYARAGQSSKIDALKPLTTTPEAAQQLSNAQAGQLPLAAGLYASGLRESSKTLLLRLPTSFERNLLLGRLYYDRHAQSDLASATEFLVNAVALNPSSLEAHQLLAAVYADRNLTADSNTQTSLAQKLTSGKL